MQGKKREEIIIFNSHEHCSKMPREDSGKIVLAQGWESNGGILLLSP